MVLSYFPLKTVKFRRILTLTEVYKHLKVAHARNIRHFEFFYGAILLPFKNCPMTVLISLAEL